MTKTDKVFIHKYLSSRSLILLLIGLCCLIFEAAASLQPESWDVPDDLPGYRVTQVIDGDTIRVEKLGKLRYIGVDSPELRHPRKGKEAFGEEAYQFNRKLVFNRVIRIQTDVQERDRYGRLLVYVYLDKIFVNAYLVKMGYAQTMTVPPNVRYAGFFGKLQRQARKAKRGLWKLEYYN